MSNVAANATGQLTVIAGKRGPVWVAVTREGEELVLREKLALQGMPDALVYSNLSIKRARIRARSLEAILALTEQGLWVQGFLFKRAALGKLRRAGLLCP